MGPGPHPPIPNPQSPIPNPHLGLIKLYFIYLILKLNIFILNKNK
jgi:hypothetical protein